MEPDSSDRSIVPQARTAGYPQVSDEVLESWQHIVDEVTARMKAPVGLIMRVDGSEIEIVRVSDGDPRRHKVLARETLEQSGLYCERVLRDGRPLSVTNAAVDPDWSGNPSLRTHGLRSYLGYPIRWPDGALFGTICVMDVRERDHTAAERDVMALLRDLIETNLRTLCAD